MNETNFYYVSSTRNISRVFHSLFYFLAIVIISRVLSSFICFLGFVLFFAFFWWGRGAIHFSRFYFFTILHYSPQLLVRHNNVFPPVKKSPLPLSVSQFSFLQIRHPLVHTFFHLFTSYFFFNNLLLFHFICIVDIVLLRYYLLQLHRFANDERPYFFSSLLIILILLLLLLRHILLLNCR